MAGVEPRAFDVLVVGWSPAGAVAATTLARGGRRVLAVVDSDPQLDRTTDPASQSALRDEQSNTLDPGWPADPRERLVPAGGPVDALLASLDVTKEESAGLPRDWHGPPLQLATADGRFDLGRSRALDLEEILRELPELETPFEALDRLGDDLDDWLTNWVARPAFAQDQPGHGEAQSAWAHLAQRAVDLLAAHTGVARLLAPLSAALPLDPQQVSPLLLARLWWRLRRGSGWPMEQLLAALGHAFTEAGGEWLAAGNALRIKTRWSRLKAIQTGQEELAVGTVIWAAPLDRLWSSLDTRRMIRKLRQSQAEWESPNQAIRIHLGLAQSGLPALLGSNLLVGQRRPTDPATPLWITCRRPLVDTEEAVITVRGSLAAAPVAHESEPRLTRAVKALLGRLDGVVPFYEAHQRWRWCPHLHPEGDVPRFGSDPSQTAPEAHLVLQQSATPPVQAASLRPGPDWLTLTLNRFPGLGLEGELLAGWQAGQAIR